MRDPLWLRDLRVETSPPLLARRRRRDVTEYVLPCVNCDAEIRGLWHPRSPYCSDRCHDIAKVIRKIRSAFARYGSDRPCDVNEAIAVTLAQALGRGYPQRARRVPKATRAAVVQRDLGRCTLCGYTGSQVDHINGDTNDLANLRLLCPPCHQRVTAERLRPITEPAMKAERDGVILRASGLRPLRPCDVPNWPWQEWMRDHLRSESGA